MPRVKKAAAKVTKKVAKAPKKVEKPTTLFSQPGSSRDGSCRSPLRSGKPVVVTGEDIDNVKAVIRVGNYAGMARGIGDRSIEFSKSKLNIPEVREKSELFVTFTQEGQSRSEPLWLEP